MSEEPENETHALILPEVPIVMPSGELPVVRAGTVGGIPAYEADPLKQPTYESNLKLTRKDNILTMKAVKSLAKKKGRKR